MTWRDLRTLLEGGVPSVRLWSSCTAAEDDRENAGDVFRRRCRFYTAVDDDDAVAAQSWRRRRGRWDYATDTHCRQRRR